MMKLRLQTLSKALSVALHPFVLPLYVMLVLLYAGTVYSRYPTATKLYLLWVVALYTLIIPLLSLAVLRSLGRLSDFSATERRERLLPLLLGAACYLLCALNLSKVPSAGLFSRFMVAAACCEAFALAITFRWKISLHLTAMGAVVAFFVLMNVAGAAGMLPLLIAAIVAAGLLASARLLLGSHNGSQVLAGFAAGFLISALVVLLL